MLAGSGRGLTAALADLQRQLRAIDESPLDAEAAIAERRRLGRQLALIQERLVATLGATRAPVLGAGDVQLLRVHRPLDEVVHPREYPHLFDEGRST